MLSVNVFRESLNKRCYGALLNVIFIGSIKSEDVSDNSFIIYSFMCK